MGKAIILLGILLVIVGSILLFAGKIPLLGNLPGDLHIRHRNFRLYFPITTCILLSTVLTIVLNLVFRR